MMSIKTKKIKRLKIRQEFCKECGLCINFCPDESLEYDEKFNSKGYHPIKWKGDCRFCGMCYTVCPDNVIEIEEYEETVEG